MKGKFHTHCEHCKKEIARWHNGRKIVGRYNPLCFDCEEQHKLAQGKFCFYCGRSLDDIDEKVGVCGPCQFRYGMVKDHPINPH